MSLRFANTFKKLRANKEMAFIPYIIGCDPDFQTSLKIMHTLVANGADALNIGFAFSDPGTAGPVLQLSNKRALKAGSSSVTCFELIKRFREDDDTTPIAILVYANAVVAYGISAFFASCRESGVDAVLIPDLPYIMLQNEVHNFKKASDDCSLILCATSNLDEEELTDISSYDMPYIYALSDVSVTNTKVEFIRPEKTVRTLKSLSAIPVIVGTGVRDCEDIKSIYAMGADGVVLGSAIAYEIENNIDNKDMMLESIAKKSVLMKTACRVS